MEYLYHFLKFIGVFTLACIHPAPLNSVQLPSMRDG